MADVPELPGCMADGDTYDKALANVREAMDLWTQTARQLKGGVPKPKGQRLFFA